MIEHIGGNPAANQSPWGSLFKTIVILRIGAGALLLTRHGWQAAQGAYDFLWKEQAWDWVKAFSDAGLPYPTLLAPTMAIIVAAVAVSWCLGFLTRLFAVVFMPVAIGVIAMAGPSYTEVGWLYMIISVTLLLYGSGAVSIDKLFRIGASWGQPKKKRW
ncbi:TQO small subunit DoxD [Prosthecobacter fusiformis]|uniref:TQO small subunit DoxD n=1 Tax=Prosthecobacter fusiformis TaxID=48464 RepID=A0A4R7RPA0_9BACT|nr:DoxX family protein [Prosthecobacter fusiformis]TDU66648.1 TQO small subunit DoxD [Prosthecobacter fusiformis]